MSITKCVARICFVLVLISVCCSALRCMRCDVSKCSELDPSTCPLGVTKNICHCCPVCFKIEGEKCGGSWNMYGICGPPLTCVNRLSGELASNEKGMCMNLKEPRKQLY